MSEAMAHVSLRLLVAMEREMHRGEEGGGEKEGKKRDHGKEKERERPTRRENAWGLV
jgi:hypothetical protein